MCASNNVRMIQRLKLLIKKKLIHSSICSEPLKHYYSIFLILLGSVTIIQTQSPQKLQILFFNYKTKLIGKFNVIFTFL